MRESIKVDGHTLDIGHLLLSPTRTFAPVMKEILENNFDAVHGLIHCSGGGQTKCLKYIPPYLRVVKDNLLPVPIVFDLIQKASGADNREMFQVFNMGTRLEIYTPKDKAEKIIATAKSFDIAAQVIGRVEESTFNELIIHTKGEEITFS